MNVRNTLSIRIKKISLNKTVPLLLTVVRRRGVFNETVQFKMTLQSVILPFILRTILKVSFY